MSRILQMWSPLCKCIFCHFAQAICLIFGLHGIESRQSLFNWCFRFQETRLNFLPTFRCQCGWGWQNAWQMININGMESHRVWVGFWLEIAIGLGPQPRAAKSMQFLRLIPLPLLLLLLVLLLLVLLLQAGKFAVPNGGHFSFGPLTNWTSYGSMHINKDLSKMRKEKSSL